MVYKIQKVLRGWAVVEPYEYSEAKEHILQALTNLKIQKVLENNTELGQPEGDYQVKPGAWGYYLVGRRCSYKDAQRILMWSLSNLKNNLVNVSE